MILAPSILSADFGMLAKQVDIAQRAGADWIHIDVMDGSFVPNISFGIPVIECLRKYTKLFFDVHLMIVNPEKHIENFIKAGADGITFHIESVNDADECINLIKKHNKKVGIAINPNTDVDKIMPYLSKIDMVLVMSVYPGYGGQKYIPDVNKKVLFLRQIMGDEFNIQIDGGINKDNIKEAVNYGANIIVAGTAIFNDDIEKSVKTLKGLCE